MYNVERYIERCIISTQSQNIPSSEFEVICVNDGSPDKSSVIAEKLSQKYSNIHVVSRINGGLSAARNTGIENAHGEYIFFLDSDDWIEDNCLLAITSILKAERPDVLAICAANVINDEPKRRFAFGKQQPVEGAYALRKRIAQKACAPFSIVKREFLNNHKLRFIEGIYHEDAEFVPRMYYLAKKVCFIDDIIYYVFQNPQSITRTSNPQKSYDYISGVCRNLSNFLSNVDEANRPYFHFLISMYINNALASIKKCNALEQKKFNKFLSQNSDIWIHLKQAGLLKYKVEYYLFSVFPHNPLAVYNLMKIWG